MTAWVDGIAQRLKAANVGDYSTTAVLDPAKPAITVAVMPEAPDRAVVLTPYPGPEPDTRDGTSYPRLQARVRAGDPLTALALDAAVFAVLQAVPGMFPITLPGGEWELQDCYSLQSDPQPMGQDANGRTEYVRNYQLTVHSV